MPAAFYKRCRGTRGGASRDPMMVIGNKAIKTSLQVPELFLCRDCENLFSKNGENYVLDQSVQPDKGRFPLREFLLDNCSLVSNDDYQIYDAKQLLGPKVELLLYFSASVFWHACARSWKVQICLGPYQESFRRYLLRQAPLPQNARIFVWVASEDIQKLLAVLPPRSERITDVPSVRMHKFYIPGLLFILLLGQKITNEFDKGGLNGTSQQLIWLRPWKDPDESLFQTFTREVRQSEFLGQLRRHPRVK